MHDPHLQKLPTAIHEFPSANLHTTTSRPELEQRRSAWADQSSPGPIGYLTSGNPETLQRQNWSASVASHRSFSRGTLRYVSFCRARAQICRPLVVDQFEKYW